MSTIEDHIYRSSSSINCHTRPSSPTQRVLQSSTMKNSIIAAPLSGRAKANKSKFILLVLIFCNLIILLLRKLSAEFPVEKITMKEDELKVEPVSFLASRFSVMIMAYLSTLAYVQKDVSLEKLISTVRWTWRRPVSTLLFIELISTASASLLLMLTMLAKATRCVLLDVLLLSSFVALLSWLGPVLFAYSDAACKLSVVASVVEERCQGQLAVETAAELIKGRKICGFLLSCVLMVLEQVPCMVFDQKKKINGEQWCIVTCFVFLMNILVKFAVYFVYTVFYFECKRSSQRRQ